MELLPVFQFDRQDCPPDLANYWGYSPVSFFAPHCGYSSRKDALGPVDEFRDLVKALHRAGIEVILDVVYNHTAEGASEGPTLCFRGLANEVYYILDNDHAHYANYSATGNTLDANQPIVRHMILDSLRYWVADMHVDGFRFDLASILDRDETGLPLENPPVLWDIESDPVLAGTKLIAEAWDAAGLYQVGTFIGDSWKEWNGRFRDDVRGFVKGDSGTVRMLAQRVLGSPDIFGHREREPEQSINFVTCHDGFTLNDLVSYDNKHNEANGEGNRDGSDKNLSWNCGVEGPISDAAVERPRQRQVKNFIVILLISVGTPMLQMGDEMRRTQRGNNNVYCQDNEASWLDWSLLDRHRDLRRFVQTLIAHRLRLLGMVSFGTSGHRGSPFRGSFTEAHILAITQAICDYRRAYGIDGPLYMGKDTHALSGPAQCTALEVLAANGVETVIQRAAGVTPTPVISHAILVHNHGRAEHLSDGIVVTPSHNPPEDGGFKYNPTHGGPADTDVTRWIENQANELLRNGNKGVGRTWFEAALVADTTHQQDFVLPYVKDLCNVIDMEAIRAAGLELAVDPLGGAAVNYWEPINTIYGLDIAVVNPKIDPTFSFMTVDHDGQIRMDCSSPYAMARLVGLKDRYNVAFANDADSDRHGIVTPGAGLMNPNHYLAVAIGYLLTHRPRWPAHADIGKTVVSSSIIDCVVHKLGRRLAEVPVGFKWFVPGLFDGSCCFGGEESAGASFLRHDGNVWTTDKDGLIMNLLAAEITACTGKDPSEHYHALTAVFGTAYYTRIDAPATPEQKARLEKLSPETVREASLAGEQIIAKLSRAPGNDAPIGGLKVVAANGWFAARPSGTEAVYKIYAESFKDEAHLDLIVSEAHAMVDKALQS